MSCRSWVEPFQFGLRMSRWLCSVCERMRVHVLRRVEALSTVWETFCGRVICGQLPMFHVVRRTEEIMRLGSG